VAQTLLRGQEWRIGTVTLSINFFGGIRNADTGMAWGYNGGSSFLTFFLLKVLEEKEYTELIVFQYVGQN
jgi:hypothetical protein